MDEQGKENGTPAENNPTGTEDYVEALKKLRDTTVPKTEYEKLKGENKRLLDNYNRDISISLSPRIRESKILLSSLKREIVSLLKGRIDIKKEEFYSIKKEMNALSPLSVLERGYALVRDENGKIIRDKKDVKNGDTLYIRVEKGEIKSIVEDNI